MTWRRSEPQPSATRCGLCGKTRKLTRTECCDRPICDDEDKYVLFSYAHNSCSRNHRRYTLCGAHHAEGHKGDWRTCQECQRSCAPEMYAYYGTNEHNFEKLPHPPSYEPSRCSRCRRVITLTTDAYFIRGNEYQCERCGPKLPTVRGRSRPSPDRTVLVAKRQPRKRGKA